MHYSFGIVGWVGKPGVYNSHVRYNCLKKMHHICDLFENHIERPTKNETTNKLKWKTVFRFVSVLFSVYMCVWRVFRNIYILRDTHGPTLTHTWTIALAGNPKLCIFFHLLKFRRILSSDAWHSLLLLLQHFHRYAIVVWNYIALRQWYLPARFSWNGPKFKCNSKKSFFFLKTHIV